VFADKEGIPVLSIAGVFNDDYSFGVINIGFSTMCTK